MYMKCDHCGVKRFVCLMYNCTDLNYCAFCSSDKLSSPNSNVSIIKLLRNYRLFVNCSQYRPPIQKNKHTHGATLHTACIFMVEICQLDQMYRTLSTVKIIFPTSLRSHYDVRIDDAQETGASLLDVHTVKI